MNVFKPAKGVNIKVLTGLVNEVVAQNDVNVVSMITFCILLMLWALSTLKRIVLNIKVNSHQIKSAIDQLQTG